jgi:hypothetical protein
MPVNLTLADDKSISVDFPPVFGYEHLAILLEKQPQTLMADRVRAPYKLPPACTPPGCKRPRWLLTDVMDWLVQYREQPASPPQPAPQPRRPGRPTKVEQIVKRRAMARCATSLDVQGVEDAN